VIRIKITVNEKERITDKISLPGDAFLMAFNHETLTLSFLGEPNTYTNFNNTMARIVSIYIF